METENTISVAPVATTIHKKVILILLTILILATTSTASYLLGVKRELPIRTTNTTVMQNPTPTGVPTQPSPTMTNIQPLNANESFIAYTDTDVPFVVRYPKSWKITKTYGKGINKLAPTDVITGIQVDEPNNLATFVVNVIDAKNASSILDWWKTGGHAAFSISQPNFSFHGVEAIKVSSTPGGNPPARVQDETYFLWKGKVYFISMQYTPFELNVDLVSIYNDFGLPQ